MNKEKVKTWIEEFEKGIIPAGDLLTEEEIQKIVVYSLWLKAKNKKLFKEVMNELSEMIKIEIEKKEK
jgi:hypothetical protein